MADLQQGHRFEQSFTVEPVAGRFQRLGLNIEAIDGPFQPDTLRQFQGIVSIADSRVDTGVSGLENRRKAIMRVLGKWLPGFQQKDCFGRTQRAVGRQLFLFWLFARGEIFPAIRARVPVLAWHVPLQIHPATGGEVEDLRVVAVAFERFDLSRFTVFLGDAIRIIGGGGIPADDLHGGRLVDPMPYGFPALASAEQPCCQAEENEAKDLGDLHVHSVAVQALSATPQSGNYGSLQARASSAIWHVPMRVAGPVMVTE